jgi:glutathione S-transferase
LLIPTDTPLLWHIPLSHFSEKVRWALDHKRIAHNRQVLGPDYLIRAWRATGPALRAAILTPLFRSDPDTALRVLTTGMPDKAYRTLRPLRKVFPVYYRFRHRIRDTKLEADRATVTTALDRIERERQGRPHLVGHAFTVADLTAAAMLGVPLQPPEIQYPLRVELPLYLQEYRASLLKHPAMHWAADIYRLHRSGSYDVAD